MKRPADLPDFEAPPLNEVVLGVQFARPNEYRQIMAGDVWSLFKSDFPVVEELQALPPSFEIFGVDHGPRINFNLFNGVQHDRFWFLTPGKEELIQFQEDRMHHNWRKVGDETNPYPRFEAMIGKFENELNKLESFFKSLDSQPLKITQCEISYINHIPYTTEAAKEEWLTFFSSKAAQPEDYAVSFRKTIHDKNSKPIGRISCDAAVGFNAKAQKILGITLTARGTPKTPTVADSLEFMKEHRNQIVHWFAELTTPYAHKQWKRIK